MDEFKIRLTPNDVESYKRELLEQSVLVDLRTAARVLSVTPKTVRNYIDDGRLTPYHACAGSKGLRVLASELRNYVRSIRLSHHDLNR